MSNKSEESERLKNRALGLLEQLPCKRRSVVTRGEYHTADVIFEVPHGDLTFELRVGPMTAPERSATAMGVFSKAVQEVLVLFRKHDALVRISSFGESGTVENLRKDLLEIVLFTGSETEAVLALKLHDFHFDPLIETIGRLQSVPLYLVHDEESYCIKIAETALDVMDRFTAAHPKCVLIHYKEESGRTVMRALDPEDNRNLKQFLDTHYELEYTRSVLEV